MRLCIPGGVGMGKPPLRQFSMRGICEEAIPTERRVRMQDWAEGEAELRCRPTKPQAVTITWEQSHSGANVALWSCQELDCIDSHRR